MLLNLGRLFWKFFFAFFLAQLCVGLGIGFTVWYSTRTYESTGIEATPPARSVVEAASITLQYGGINGLRSLMERWQTRRMPQVYAVDEAGSEVLGRPLTAATVEAAMEIVETFANERYVKRLMADDGHQYLIFVPRFGREKQPAAQASATGNPLAAPSQLQLDESADTAASELSDLPPDLPSDESDRRPFKVFPVRPLVIGTLVSLFFAAILAWYFSKPIQHLRLAFNEAASGRLEMRIGGAMGRRDELADLGRDFDSMADRLGSLLQGQTRLLHHVSHELRSPLARLQMAIGLARQKPENINASLERIERESVRMDKLVGELLELSRLESGVINIQRETIDISELLQSIVEDARFEAESLFPDAAARPVIVLNENARFTVHGNPELLYRAIENTVRNALKYSPPYGQIVLEVAAQDIKAKTTMRLTISDDGPGIPPSELGSIFQPFVRGSTAKTGEGHGVGLAIAQQVVEAHGGTIAAVNRPDKGLVIEIILPYFSIASA